jgi:hypothetical protein
MMTTNLFVIANVKSCEPAVVLEFYCLFFRTYWAVGFLNSAIFNSFHNRVAFGTILEGLPSFGGGGEGVEPPKPPPPRAPPEYRGPNNFRKSRATAKSWTPHG